MVIEIEDDLTALVIDVAFKTSGVNPDSERGWELWRDLETALRVEIAEHVGDAIRGLIEGPKRLLEVAGQIKQKRRMLA
jgi:hypothetical protein